MKSSNGAGLPSGNTTDRDLDLDAMEELRHRMERAREISHGRHGKKITFFLPGMFSLNGVTGKYPAVSITGNRCALRCEHCKGTLLSSMIHSETPEQLVERCLSQWEKGAFGVLISGGCDRTGGLPWKAFLPAIEEIKQKTDLFVSVHSGIVDAATAKDLKDAGVDQALVDIIGDDETYRAIYHVDFGISKKSSSLWNIFKMPAFPSSPTWSAAFFTAGSGEKKRLSRSFPGLIGSRGHCFSDESTGP